MDENAKKILSKFQAQCAKREYCRSEIAAKVLKALDGNKEVADEVISSLVKDRFIDDSRYASAFAREKAAIAGWGPVKIRFALTGKGISREVIDDALIEIDQTKAGDRMEKVLRSKWHSLKADPQGKLKLIRFALSRGYEYDSVSRMIDTICRG